MVRFLVLLWLFWGAGHCEDHVTEQGAPTTPASPPADAGVAEMPPGQPSHVKSTLPPPETVSPPPITTPATPNLTDDPTTRFVTCLAEYGLHSPMFVKRPTPEVENATAPPSHARVSAYNQLNRQWISRGGTVLPLGFLVARNVSHVQAGVVCGRRLGIRVVPRSGGHGFTKFGFGDPQSIVIDLGHLNQVTVGNSAMRAATALIGPGTRLGQVAWTLFAQGGYLTAIGLCPSVAMGGLALGGGYGPVSRLHGLTTDNVVEIEMVDVDGVLRTVTNATNPDLFWALRGAGAVGQFGIVTQFRFRLHPAPFRLAVAVLEYDFTSFAPAFTAWAALFKLSANLPRSISSYFTVTRFGRIRISLHDAQNEEAASAFGVDRIQRLMASFPGEPSPSPQTPNATLVSFTYPDYLASAASVSYHGVIKPQFNISSGADLPRLGVYDGVEFFKGKSLHISKELEAADVEHLYKLLQAIVPGVRVNFEPYGGAINDPSAPGADNSFLHRGAIWTHVSLYYEAEPGQESPSMLRGLADFFESSKAVLNHTESYQNYVDDELGDWMERYFPGEEARERLLRVKMATDPENYFNNPMSLIPVKRRAK